MSSYFLNRFLDYFRAPFTLLALLACAAACGGSAFAQSTPSVSQQTSQSNSTTPDGEFTAAHFTVRGYVGVYLGDLNAERARDLGLKEIRGAVVGRVEEGSPAASAGLQENDVILAFNTERVQNRAHFYRLLINSQPGSAISLGISRGGAEQRLAVVLGQRRLNVPDPCQRLFSEANAHLASATESRKLAEESLQKGDEKEARRFFDEEKMFRQLAEESRAYIEGEIRDGKIAECQPSPRPGYNPVADRYQIGVIVAPLTAQLADFFNAAQDSLLITEVRAGDLGAQAGLKAGDCIVTVGGKTVKSTSDIDRLLNQGRSGELEFAIVRDRSERKIKIKLDQK
jgi:membrane-associated protease RseP (regulator of RpoE activity)